MKNVRMRRYLSVLAAAAFLAAPIKPVLAAEVGSETSNTVDAGVTPDSIVYPIDKAIESIQLTLTFTAEGKVILLTDISQERLEEAKVMAEENKDELAVKQWKIVR